jgi:hypothetical protein
MLTVYHLDASNLGLGGGEELARASSACAERWLVHTSKRNCKPGSQIHTSLSLVGCIVQCRAIET